MSFFVQGSQAKLKELFWLQIGSHLLVINTVRAEQSLHLILGLFGFDWVAIEFKPSLIMSYKVLECYVAPPAEMSLY